MRHHLLNTIAVFSLITVITACSFKSVYNNLDYLIPEYAEDIVSLDDVLQEEFEHRTLVLLNWHRNTQLNQYADWLTGIQQDIGPQLTQQQVLLRLKQAEQFWLSLAVKINHEMALLLPMLNQQQQAELFSNLTEKNEDFREEYVDIDETQRREEYYDDLYNSYENWFGDLSEQQEQLIKPAAGELVSTMAVRLQQRLKWQNGIQTILSSTESNEEKSRQLREFFAEFEISSNPEMQQKSEVNNNILARLTVEIVHSVSPEQKDFFISKTNEYIRMFRELAENR